MLDIFKVTLSQSILLFFFIAIGYWFKKIGKLPEQFNKGLSNLLVNIFLPFLTFSSMAKNFKLDVLGEKINIIIIASAFLVMCFVVAFIFARVFAKERNTQDVYMYSFMFANSGYIGNPLILACFGELMLFDFIIFTIPFFFVTYTYGIYILNPNRKFNLKSICNPIMIALVLGMIVGALNIEIPTVVQSIVDTGANCMAPAAMILTGVVFASNDLKAIVSNKKVYLAVGIKLILIPIAAILLIASMNVPYSIAIILITMVTLPTGLNSIVFPEAYGGDSRTGAQLCFVSTLTSLIIMPIMFSFYSFLTI